MGGAGQGFLRRRGPELDGADGRVHARPKRAGRDGGREDVRSARSAADPLIGRIHGAALGGGAGLAAICDIVVAGARAIFGFTEVKLGILPAIVSPYVIAQL